MRPAFRWKSPISWARAMPLVAAFIFGLVKGLGLVQIGAAGQCLRGDRRH